MPTADLGPTGRRLADHVKAARGRMSLRELSERMTQVGRPILPSGLLKIERGERRVDVDDLVALGQALGLPPILLLYMPHPPEEWDEARWFMGDALAPGGEADSKLGRLPTVLLRRHDRLIENWREAPALARYLGADPRTGKAQPAVVAKLQAWPSRELRFIRNEMRRFGMPPPALPDGLAHVDDEGKDE